MKRFLCFLLAAVLVLGCFVSVQAMAFEPFQLKVQRIGLGNQNTTMRFVVSNSCLPSGISEADIVGSTVSGTMQYLADEAGRTDLVMQNNEVIGFEPGASTSVVVIASNDSVSASMVDDGSGKYNCNLTVTQGNVPAENVRTFQVTFQRGGTSKYIRLVVATSDFPEDISAEDYAGAKITGTLTHKTDAALSLVLDNEIASIEKGESTTVINVKDSESCAQANFVVGSTYTGKLTITVAVQEKPENTQIVPEKGTAFYIPADYFYQDLGRWKEETDGSLKVVKADQSDITDNCTALIDVPEDNAYYVYAFSKNLTASSSGKRNYRLQINNILFSTVLGAHTTEGWKWEYVGKIDLKKGANTVELYSEAATFARCGGLMLTTESDFEPVSAAYLEEAFQNYSVPKIEKIDFSHVYTSGLNLSFYLKNRTAEPIENAVLIAAVYNAEDMLVDVRVQTVEHLDAYAGTEKIQLAFQPTSPWTKGKVMLFKSMDTLVPLAPYAEFTYQDPDYSVPETGGESYGSIAENDWRLSEYYEKEANVRSGIPNVWNKLSSGGDVKIAFLGGSVTEQYKWSESVLRWMKQKFPEAQITDYNIGLSGTGTWVGTIRMDKDILSLNPDLIFIEYGGNGGTSPQMEGIFRKIWTYNPNIDIVMVNTMHADWYQTYKNGSLPDNISRFEEIAEHYGVPSASFGYQVVEYYDQGKVTLSGDAVKDKILYAKDGIHPTADGGQLAGGAVVRSLIRMSEVGTEPTAHTIPEPMFEDHWAEASSLTFNDFSKAEFEGDWFDCLNDGTGSQYGTNYEYTGGYVSMFKRIFSEGMKGTKQAGASVTVKFRGRNIGIFEAGGQYSGQLKVYVDGKLLSAPLQLYCSYDTKPRHQLYYITPQLEYGEHIVKFELDSTMPDKSANQSKNPNDTNYAKNELYIGRIVSDGEILDIHN